MTSERFCSFQRTQVVKIWFEGTFQYALPIRFLIFEIGVPLPPIRPPRGSSALKAPKKSKFGLRVLLKMLYLSALELLKLKVPYLLYDLREVLHPSGHLRSQNSVYKYALTFVFLYDLPINSGTLTLKVLDLRYNLQEVLKVDDSVTKIHFKIHN